MQEMTTSVTSRSVRARQLHGLTMHSERPGTQDVRAVAPYGVVGIITAFNFLWPSGAGTACSPGYAVIPVCGSPVRRPALQHRLPAHRTAGVPTQRCSRKGEHHRERRALGRRMDRQRRSHSPGQCHGSIRMGKSVVPP